MCVYVCVLECVSCCADAQQPGMYNLIVYDLTLCVLIIQGNFTLF